MVDLVGLDLNTPVFDIFKALPTPDIMKLFEHIHTLDTNTTIVGCLNTKGQYKTLCLYCKPINGPLSALMASASA